MNKHLRLHAIRRRDAIDRLRSLTTGAIVAGTAGTIGFGALAAATYSGTSTAGSATNGDQPGAISDGGNSGSGNVDPGGATTPGNRGLWAAPTPRPAPTHHSHVVTGGSGG